MAPSKRNNRKPTSPALTTDDLESLLARVLDTRLTALEHRIKHQIGSQMAELNAHFEEVDLRLNQVNEVIKYHVEIQKAALEDNLKIRELYGEDCLAYLDVVQLIAARRLKLPREGDLADKFIKSLFGQIFTGLTKQAEIRTLRGQSKGVDSFDVAKTIEIAMDAYNETLTFDQFGFEDDLLDPQKNSNLICKESDYSSSDQDSSDDDDPEGGEEESEVTNSEFESESELPFKTSEPEDDDEYDDEEDEDYQMDRTITNEPSSKVQRSLRKRNPIQNGHHDQQNQNPQLNPQESSSSSKIINGTSSTTSTTSKNPKNNGSANESELFNSSLLLESPVDNVTMDKSSRRACKILGPDTLTTTSMNITSSASSSLKQNQQDLSIAPTDFTGPMFSTPQVELEPLSKQNQNNAQKNTRKSLRATPQLSPVRSQDSYAPRRLNVYSPNVSQASTSSMNGSGNGSSVDDVTVIKRAPSSTIADNNKNQIDNKQSEKNRWSDPKFREEKYQEFLERSKSSSRSMDGSSSGSNSSSGSSSGSSFNDTVVEMRTTRSRVTRATASTVTKGPTPKEPTPKDAKKLSQEIKGQNAPKVASKVTTTNTTNKKAPSTTKSSAPKKPMDIAQSTSKDTDKATSMAPTAPNANLASCSSTVVDDQTASTSSSTTNSNSTGSKRTNSKNPAPNSKNPTPNSNNPTPNSNNPAPNSKNPAPNSNNPTPNSNNPAPNSNNPSTKGIPLPEPEFKVPLLPPPGRPNQSSNNPIRTYSKKDLSVRKPRSEELYDSMIQQNPLQSTVNQDLTSAGDFSAFVTASDFPLSIIHAADDTTVGNDSTTNASMSTTVRELRGRKVVVDSSTSVVNVTDSTLNNSDRSLRPKKNISYKRMQSGDFSFSEIRTTNKK